MRNAANEYVDELGYVQNVCGLPNFDHPYVAPEDGRQRFGYGINLSSYFRRGHLFVPEASAHNFHPG
jgi:hypothetical protein